MPRRRFFRSRYRHSAISGGENGQGTSSAPEVLAPVGSPGQGPYKCDVAECSKEYARWKELKRHQRSHDNDKPHRCDRCEMSFNVAYNLRLHKATHNAENLECPECKKRFSRVASLKSHIMMHEKEEVLICPECGDEFGLQRVLDEHLLEHAVETNEPKEHQCKICHEKFPMHYMLKEHMRQKHKPKLRAAVMTTKFTRRTVDRTRFLHKCSFCSKTFSKPSQLERHIRIHTGEKPYKCPQCDRAFNQNGALQVHMTKHTGTKPYQCEFCGQKFAQRGNLRAHIVRVHEINSELDQRFECPQCCCNFRKMSSLNAHISRFHNGEEAANPLLSLKAALSAIQEGADWLDSTVDTNALAGALEQLIIMLEQNVSEGDTLDRIQEIMTGTDINTDILQQALENSGVSNNEGQKDADPATVQAEAAVSGTNQLTQLFTFVSEILQRRVMVKRNIPAGTRVHTCNYCGKTFKKPSDLVRHVRIHTNEKPYLCSQCDKTFTVKSTLMSHMKTHAGIKEYKCNECYKMFATHGSLKVHLRLHTGAKPFECEHCDKKFRTTGQRKVHMISHFKDPAQRKARAAQVRARNARNSEADIDLPDVPLQEPILITDTGLIQQPPRNSGMYNNYISEGLQQVGTSSERPYICNFCQKCFKKSSHLKQHVRSHTGERPYQCVTCLKSFISSGVLKAHEKTHIGIKSYKCLICDCLFTTNGSLKRHMSTHTDVRPFMCPYCQKTFKTSVNCKKHMKMHKRELALQAKQQEEHVQEIQTISEQASNLAEQLSLEQASNSILALAHGQLTVNQDALNAQTALNEASLATQALAHQNLGQGNLLTDGLTHDALAQTALGQNYAHTFSQQTLDSITNAQAEMPTENQISLQTQQIQQQLEAITGHSSSLFSQPNHMQVIQEELTAVTTQLPATNTSTVMTSSDTDIKRAFPCMFCEKVFKKSSHLKQHVRSHTGEKPCQCVQCGRSFVSPGVLKNHMRIHTGVKGYKCKICDTSFTTNGSLVRHMNIHTDQRPHQCTQCGEAFRKQMDLKRHMKEHATDSDTGEDLEDGRRPKSVIRFNEEEAEQIAKKPLARNASTSERILVQMVNEKNRLSEVMSKEEELKRRPKFANSCTHCSKSFKKPCDLVRHVRTHTGEKPFKCPVCERTFAVKSTLVCHIRTHKGGKQEKCHICKTTFATVGSLKVHMRLHTGSKPFKCPQCDECFRTSGSRKQHMESHLKPNSGRKRKTNPDKITTDKENKNSEDVIIETSDSGMIPQDSHVLQASQNPVSTEQAILQTMANNQQVTANGQQTVTVGSQDGDIGAAVLTGLELQLSGTNLGQNLQIHGLDANNITVQIDPSLLQQLQQLQQQNPVALQTGELNLGQANLQLSQPDLSTIIGGQEVTMSHGLQNAIDPQTGLLVQMDPSALQQVPQMVRIDTGVPNQQTIHVQTTSSSVAPNQQPQVIVQNSGLHDIMQKMPEMQNQSTLISNAAGASSQQPDTQAAFLQGADIQMALPESLVQSVSQGEATIGNQVYTIHTSDRGTHLVQAEPPASQSDTSNLGQSFQLSFSGDQLSLQPNIILQQSGLQNAEEYTSAAMSQTEEVTITPGNLVDSSESSGTVTVNVVDLANLTQHGHAQTTSTANVTMPQEEEESDDEEEDGEDEEEMEEEDDSDDDNYSYPNEDRSARDIHKELKELRDKPTLSAKDAAAAIGSIYPCTVQGCREVFTKMQLLSRHQQQKHKSLRPHTCYTCGKSFKRPGHLKDHQATHAGSGQAKGGKRSGAGGGGGSHVCLQCSKSFAKPSQLQRHSRIHTGEKPYSCPECFKSFSQKNSLQIHMNVHTKERPHKCPYCELAFSQKGNLKTHLVRAHKLAPDAVNQTSTTMTSTATSQEDIQVDIERLFAS